MKPIHVMTVDDSPLVCSLIEMVLASDMNIDVTHRVGTAREAMQALDSGDVDVITLDLNLPDGEGIDMVELLTATHEHGVVVVSGNTDLHAVAIRLGATACFEKPHLLDHVQDFITAIHAAASAKKH